MSLKKSQYCKQAIIYQKYLEMSKYSTCFSSHNILYYNSSLSKH